MGREEPSAAHARSSRCPSWHSRSTAYRAAFGDRSWHEGCPGQLAVRPILVSVLAAASAAGCLQGKVVDDRDPASAPTRDDGEPAPSVPEDAGSGATVQPTPRLDAGTIADDGGEPAGEDGGLAGPSRTYATGETIVTLATGQTQPYCLAVDGKNVYWAAYGDNTVMKVPVDLPRDGAEPALGHRRRRDERLLVHARERAAPRGHDHEGDAKVKRRSPQLAHARVIDTNEAAASRRRRHPRPAPSVGAAVRSSFVDRGAVRVIMRASRGSCRGWLASTHLCPPPGPDPGYARCLESAA